MAETMRAEGVVAIQACRSCGGRPAVLSDVLGCQYVSGFPRRPRADDGHPAPLVLVRCEACGLVQLSHTVSRDRLYREYWYRSGIQPAMVDSLRELTTYALRFANVESGDWVVDVGANDGTLLRLFAETCAGVRLNRVAFDPAVNLHSDLARNCDVMVPDYFPSKEYDAPRAKVIFSVAMFYSQEDPRAFVREVRRNLHRDGVWVLQLGDLRAVLEDNAFDGICHEHVCYYSLKVLKELIEQEGLQVADAQRNLVNGGSVRLAVIHPNEYVTGSADLQKTLLQESGLDEPKVWRGWAENIADIRTVVRKVIDDEWAGGGTVDAYGASTKGNTLLQYFGLDGISVRRALERSPAKWGRYTAGSWIPIVSEEQGRAEPATLLLVLPWHFRRAILARERERGWPRGTRMLFPLPWPEIVEV